MEISAATGLKKIRHKTPSGTEPKIKIYYTTLGKDLAEAEAEKEKLAKALEPMMA